MLMAILMMVIGKTIRRMVEEYVNMLMVLSTMVIGNKTKKMDEEYG